MNQKELRKQIVDYFVSYEDEDLWLSDKEVKVDFIDLENHSNKPSVICLVHFDKMYQGLGNWVCFANLKWLAELLGTSQINLKDEFYREGCDTCDYGSSHSITIECLNVKLE